MSTSGGILLLISFILLGYWGVRWFKRLPAKRFGWSALVLLIVSLFMIGSSSNSSASHASNDRDKTKAELKATPKRSSKAASSQSHQPAVKKRTHHVAKVSHRSVINKLVAYTNKQSAGPTGDYYWHIGKARLNGFKNLKTGGHRFSADSQSRPSTARAKLTYRQYAVSRGSRQGDPKEPYAWPSTNPIVAISYASTGRTYHGYLWNRSHSIGDSLLGADSYESSNNFTTGTRPQNVGADQDGGMRYAEETVENYWTSHANTDQTVYYQTTPLYHGNESMPRGSVIDIKSTDGVLDTEIAVINDAEGIKINYNDGSNNAKPYHRPTHVQQHRTVQSTTHNPRTSRSHYATSTAPSKSPAQATTSGKWHVASQGYVFVSESNKYYTRVTNPANYTYETTSAAQSSGATQAIRGNQYAQP